MPDPLVRRLETAEAGTLLALARAADRAIPDHAPAHCILGEAVAARFGQQSPINAVKGWGLDAPDPAHLHAALEVLEILEILGERGYRAVVALLAGDQRDDVCSRFCRR